MPQPNFAASGFERGPVQFIALALALAVPIWLLGPHLGVLPGLRVPASDLLLGFVPAIAALCLLVRGEGLRSAAKALRDAVSLHRLPGGRWLAATLLTAPILYLASWNLMRMTGGAALPMPDPMRLVVLFALFLALAAGEEIGWTGYLFDPLATRLGPVRASLVIAAPWWLGHLPSMLAIGATGVDIAWWALAAPALRILFTWLYLGTGRCLASAVLFHALLNLSRIALYPADGSHYQTAYQATGSVLAAIMAALVIRNLRQGIPASAAQS